MVGARRLMASVLIIGSSVGAVVGFIHAWCLYVRLASEFPERRAEHPVAVRARAAYFALWVFFLWVLFGAYVFFLWVISVVIYTIYHAGKRVPNLIPSR